MNMFHVYFNIKISSSIIINILNINTILLPKLPTQHLAASKSGVCKMNFFKLSSYKALVLISLVLVPCAISVSAKQPGI